MRGLLLAAVLGFTALVYQNSLNSMFVFDVLAVAGALQRGLPPDVAREFGMNHRPLTWWTYRMDYRHGELDPLWFRVSNLAIHLIAVALVFGIVSLLLGNAYPAAFGALIFGIHPFFGAAVTYVDARATMLAAMFVFAAVYALLRIPSAWKWPAASALLALGLASKEEALVFFPLAFAYGVVMRKKALAVAMAALMIAGVIGIAFAAPYVGTPLNTSVIVPVESMRINGGYNGVDLVPYWRSVAIGYAFHTLGNLLLPVKLTIDPMPEYGWLKFAASLAILLVLAGIALARRLEPPIRLAAAALLCCPLLGCFWVLLAEPLFEYRNYALGLGIALASASLYKWAEFWIRPTPILAGAVVFALAFGSIHRNETTRTAIGAWRDALDKAPYKERPAQNLSADLLRVGRRDEAEKLLLDEIKVHPEFRGAHANLALIYLDTNRLDLAERHAKLSLPISQGYAYLAVAQLKRFNPEAALPLAEKSLADDGSLEVGLMAKSDALTMLNRMAEAKEVQETINRNRKPKKA